MGKIMRSFVAVVLVVACVTGSAEAGESATGEVSLETMIGQMVMVGFRGLHADPESAIGKDIRAGRVGGIILFDYDVALKTRPRNIESPAQVQALVQGLQAMTPDTLLVGVDQEGGKVMRLKPRYGFPDAPPAAALGAAGDAEATREVGAAIGQTLAAVGVNVNFAPVVDVDVNPENPVIGGLDRSFSSDPEEVARLAAAFIEGLHSRNVLSCLKHFPGHGSSTEDSHLGLTDVTRTWSEQELVPYRRLVAAGLADMVMTAHIVNRTLDPELPASLSKRIITGMLRRELGYEGVVVSDDLQMGAITHEYGGEEAAALAVQAGADILLFGNNLHYEPDVARRVVAHLAQEVRAGRIDRLRIRESFERIRALKDALAP